jgi:hypothetical protein
MESPQAVTGLKKRQQIKSANKTVFIWVIIASIAVGVGGVVSEFMFRQLLFNNKIIAAKSKTNDTIKANISAYDSLKEEVTKLLIDTNLNALKKGESSTPLQVVLDALPTEDNKPAFAASMQLEVLAPTQVKLDGFSISTNENTAVAAPTVTTPIPDGTTPVSFDFSITGHYQQVIAAVKNMERSIRPMDIQNIKFEGSEAAMKASISAVTYYQTAKQTNLQKEQVKP